MHVFFNSGWLTTNDFNDFAIGLETVFKTSENAFTYSAMMMLLEVFFFSLFFFSFQSRVLQFPGDFKRRRRRKSRLEKSSRVYEILIELKCPPRFLPRHPIFRASSSPLKRKNKERERETERERGIGKKCLVSNSFVTKSPNSKNETISIPF